jgi:hypothetical protein
MRFLLCLLALITFFSCQKNDDETFVSVKKNGKKWKAEVGSGRFYTTRNWVVLGFSVKDKDDILKEGLDITVLPPSTGVFPLDTCDYQLTAPNVLAMTLLGDGDVGGDFYLSPKPMSGNEVEIIRFDTVAKIIEGRFAFTLVRDRSRPKVSDASPDQWEFTEGEFRANFDIKE